jgi:hypothetical protein
VNAFADNGDSRMTISYRGGAGDGPNPIAGKTIQRIGKLVRAPAPTSAAGTLRESVANVWRTAL